MVVGEFASGRVVSEGARGSIVLPRVARRRGGVYCLQKGVLRRVVGNPRRLIVSSRDARRCKGCRVLYKVDTL